MDHGLIGLKYSINVVIWYKFFMFILCNFTTSKMDFKTKKRTWLRLHNLDFTTLAHWLSIYNSLLKFIISQEISVCE